MKVFKFELLKLAKNRFIMSTFVMLLFLCGALFYFQCSSDVIQPQAYLALHHKVDALPFQEAKVVALDLLDTYAFYDEYQISIDKEAYLKKQEQSKGKQWVTEKLADDKNLDGDKISINQKVVERLLKELDTVETYTAYRTSLVEQVHTNQAISIFKDNKNEALNKKVLAAYEKIDKQLALKVTPSLGLEKLLSFSIPDIFGILFLVYLIGMSVYQERKRGFTAFTETMVNGKKVQYFSKLFSIMLVSGGWLVCAYAVCGVLSNFLYSLPSSDIAIQSIPLFMKSIIQGNVIHLVGMFLVQKLIVMALLTSLCYTIAQYLRSYPALLFLLITLFGCSYFAYTRIPELSSFVVVKYLNFYGILQHLDYLGNYICFSLFQLPFSINQGLCFLLFIIGGVTILTCFHKTVSMKKKAMIIRRSKSSQPLSLFFYECKKVWIKDYGCFLFGILLIFQMGILANTRPNQSIDDIYYNHYVDRIGDHVSEQGNELLEKTQMEFDQIQMGSSEAMEYKEIELMNHYSAFTKYREHYERLKQREEGRLLKENEYAFLFENSFVNHAAYALLMIGMLLSINASFYREKETGMEKLQSMSINGGKVVWKYKIMAVLTFILPLCLMLYSMILWRNHQFFPHLNLASDLNNLSMFTDFGISMPISIFLGFMMLIRVLLTGMLVIMISYLSKRIQNRYANLFLLILSCVLPYLLVQLTGILVLDPLYSLMSVSLLTTVYQVVGWMSLFLVLGSLCFRKGCTL